MDRFNGLLAAKSYPLSEDPAEEISGVSVGPGFGLRGPWTNAFLRFGGSLCISFAILSNPIPELRFRKRRYGDLGGTRTRYLRSRNPALYPLSYEVAGPRKPVQSPALTSTSVPAALFFVVVDILMRLRWSANE